MTDARRHVDGVVLLDKPRGLTSNRALQLVKQLFRARKAGHTGSLDPLASGLLPICLGQATKVSAYLLDADKRYRVTAQLGVRTDTGDADGKVVESAPSDHVTPDRIEEALARFRGPIRQVPPMYSALKHKGQRLYELARQGKEIEREPRPIRIHRLELEQYAHGVLVFDVECSKGTYVRSLVEDIAVAAGTLAHVTALRRLRAGPYCAEQMVTLEVLDALAARGALDEILLPADSALQGWPAVRVGADRADRLMQGCTVAVDEERAGGLVRVYEERQFLGIGELGPGGRLAPKRLFRGHS
ncbi:MAG: tRNA pseudouridine(55) synthase TruB [Gammaproteobacteria bacterium]|nr:tRNA pseudouridine(55) synthase TruB [Gammaproteobacteria bacterium]